MAPPAKLCWQPGVWKAPKPPLGASRVTLILDVNGFTQADSFLWKQQIFIGVISLVHTEKHLEWNFIQQWGGGVAGGERRESDGKVSFFFSLTTTSFLHSLETIFLFQLNGKSPKYKGLMGGISLKSTLRCLPSISSISSFPSYPRPLEFLSFCPLWPHLHYLHQLPTKKTLCTLF